MKKFYSNLKDTFSSKNKGWFRRYLAYRQRQPLETPLSELGLGNDKCQQANDKQIYYLLQPTGLFYGLPLRPPFRDLVPDAIFTNPNPHHSAQLVFTEGLLATLVADRQQQLLSADEPANLFSAALDHAVRYFLPGFVKEPSDQQEDELLPDHLMKAWENWVALKIKLPQKGNTFFNALPNSLLLLEMIECLKEQRYQFGDEALPDRQLLIQDLFQVIHAAIQANGQMEAQEAAMFDHFLSSAELASRTKSYLKQLVKKDAELDDLEFATAHPWLIRRFYLEIATLFTMADRQLEKSEEIFLEKLGDRLNLESNNVEESILATEVFMAENDQAFNQITSNNSNFLVKDIRARAKKAVDQNRKNLAQEIRESRELYQLLQKGRSMPLTAEEKEKVRSQLVDILKTIPVFVIIGLPGTFMTLPFLISILPMQYFPTAFQDQNREDQKMD